MKLVIATRKPKEIGKTYRNITDVNGKLHPGQAYRVVAVSTREEYIKCLVSFGEEAAWVEMLADIPHYYEIQTD